MKIELSTERHAWIDREVAAGNFPSIEAAIEQALHVYEHHLTALRAELDPALAALDRGEGQDETMEIFLARMQQKHPKT